MCVGNAVRGGCVRPCVVVMALLHSLPYFVGQANDVRSKLTPVPTSLSVSTSNSSQTEVRDDVGRRCTSVPADAAAQTSIDTEAQARSRRRCLLVNTAVQTVSVRQSTVDTAVQTVVMRPSTPGSPSSALIDSLVHILARVLHASANTLRQKHANKQQHVEIH